MSESNRNFREAVCIHTDKIYDSCRDKDCLENIRVYLTSPAQSVVDDAISVKCTKAEIIWVFSDVDRSKYNLKDKENYTNRFLMSWGYIPTVGRLTVCISIPCPKYFQGWSAVFGVYLAKLYSIHKIINNFPIYTFHFKKTTDSSFYCISVWLFFCR